MTCPGQIKARGIKMHPAQHQQTRFRVEGLGNRVQRSISKIAIRIAWSTQTVHHGRVSSSGDQRGQWLECVGIIRRMMGRRGVPRQTEYFSACFEADFFLLLPMLGLENAFFERDYSLVLTYVICLKFSCARVLHIRSPIEPNDVMPNQGGEQEGRGFIDKT